MHCRKLAFARRENINASFKDLANVCANIRNRNAKSALEFLEQAAAKKRPIRYFKHNKRRGHLRELGGKKGGYPVKSVKIVLEVLKNALANASAKGLGDCRVVHAVANKQHIYRRLAPKGRRIRHDLETAFVEIVLREISRNISRNISSTKKEEQPKAQKEEKEQKAKEEKKEKTKAQESAKAVQTSKAANTNEEKVENKNPEEIQKTSNNLKKPKKFSEVIKKSGE
ncbi:MAG: hypothetical protein N3D10_01520 [Candidatus Micrarchaeota archaeon]|nr:hypothetical protein [Candidatus Micrarchaeota archaeon]